MRCPMLVLVNAAEVRDSMLYVLGAAPEWVSVSSERGPLRVAFAVSLEAERHELGRRFDLEVVLEDAEGEIARSEFPIQPARRDPESFVAGAPLLVNLCGDLQADLRAVGGHSLRLMLGEDELARTRFGVRLAS